MKDNKRNLGKFVLILAIVIILAFASYYSYNKLSYKIGLNNEVKRLNVNTLNVMKCWSSCPYEEKINLNENVTSPIAECLDACTDKYNPVETAGISGKYNKSIEEVRGQFVLYDFETCFGLIESENEFKTCLNEKIQENSNIIDLTNENLQADYYFIDIKIQDLKCTKTDTKLKINLTQGNIKSLIITLHKGENLKQSILVATLPTVGIVKAYEFNYKERGITVVPDSVSIEVRTDKHAYEKQRIAC